MTNIAIYDHENFRLRSDALEKLINSYASLQVVYRSCSFGSITQFCNINLPDVVLISSSRVEESLKESFKEIKQLKDNVKVVLLTNKVSSWVIPNLKALGIQGYLVMGTKSVNLLEGLEQVKAGNMYCCSEVSSVMLRMYTDIAIEFSDCERSVIKLLVADHSSKEIAEELCVSVHTVVSYRKAILKKFGVKSTAGIVRKAIESGYS